MGTERLLLQTSTEQIFSAAPLGLGLFLKSIFPGLHPLRGFHPGLSSAAPLGLTFLEIRDFVQGKPQRGERS